jgi:hypothetical protein
VEQIDDEAFNVRTVVVLIRHDHDVAVAQVLARGGQAVVRLVEVQAQDGDHAGYLLVADGDLGVHAAHVQQLATQREHAVQVSSDD